MAKPPRQRLALDALRAAAIISYAPTQGAFFVAFCRGVSPSVAKCRLRRRASGPPIPAVRVGSPARAGGLPL